MTLLKHLPALQVLLPLFAALFSAVSFRPHIARVIAISAIVSSLVLAIYGINLETSYFFGDWAAPIGIEYRLDKLNQPAIIYINAVLLFFLVFCHHLTNSSILSIISPTKRHLFYSILLFAHTGYVGMLSTNDLFNLYVFIEISSLSAYVLIAQGNNPLAPIGAFDYLMLGTIGATLILIAIGLLLSSTGSLNINDINHRLHGGYQSKIVLTACGFFLVGVILKMAFFPLHFWMIRAYTAAAPVMLAYLASIAGIIGTYIFFRFANSTIEYDKIFPPLSTFLRPIALSTLLLCPFLAAYAKNLPRIIAYSAATQIGYVILLLTIPNTSSLLVNFLLFDSLNKIALFLLAAYAKEQIAIPRYLLAIILICSAGLPITGMFILKLNILGLLLQQNMILSFIITIIASAVTLIYHYKIATYSILPTGVKSSSCSGLIFIIIMQFLLAGALLL